jgi:hypothetical protein
MGEGLVDIFELLGRNHYRRADRMIIAAGVRISLFILQLKPFSLAVPYRNEQAAETPVGWARR